MSALKNLLKRLPRKNSKRTTFSEQEDLSYNERQEKKASTDGQNRASYKQELEWMRMKAEKERKQSATVSIILAPSNEGIDSFYEIFGEGAYAISSLYDFRCITGPLKYIFINISNIDEPDFMEITKGIVAINDSRSVPR